MSKIHSPKQFSYLFSYSDEDIANQLGISPKTVVAWRQKGLKPIDNHRPTLYHGFNIKETLGKMNNKRKVKLELSQFYCLGCKDITTPLNGKIMASNTGPQVRIIGICPECKKCILKTMNWDQFHQIQKIYKVVEQSQLYDSELSHLNQSTNTNKKGE